MSAVLKTPAAFAQAEQPRAAWFPTTSDGVDIAAVSILTALALVGLRTVFSGTGYLAAGVLGLVIGLAVAYLALAARLPLIAVVAVGVIAYFVFGGVVALRDATPGGSAPTLSVMRDVAHVSIYGWKDLLTTVPPADGSDGLFVLPYLLGLFAGLGGLLVARRFRTALVPAVFPAISLSVVVLLGTRTPAAAIWQGLAFACVALVWASLRHRRSHPVTGTMSARTGRFATAGAVLVAVAAGTWGIGAVMPGATAADRVVLRTYVVPPFDINNYPSPLVGFRKYTKDANKLYDQTLFTVTGLPSGASVRIATLDSYDGSVWGATQDPGAADSTSTDAFQQVGTNIPGAPAGRRVRVHVEIGVAYADASDVNAWLPDAGDLSQIAFLGTDQAMHANQFRFNLSTDSGIVPDRLQAGDRYSFTTVLPDEALGKDPQPFAAPTMDPDAYAFLSSKATQWAAPSGNSSADQSSDVWTQVTAVAAHLMQSGAYSDGGPGEQQYLPGHSEFRLSSFLSGTQPVGDDEQYAATFALMANDLGLPARVVLGATPEPDGVVKGQDVHAWVEVHVADGRWVDIPQSMFMPNPNKKPDQQPPPTPQKASSTIVPPPQAARPPDAETSGQAQAIAAHAPKGRTHNQFHLPAWLVRALRLLGPPIVVIGCLVLLILGLKARRRRARRTRGVPTQRLARGWTEVLDHARDLGIRVPHGSTRREQSKLLDLPAIEELAVVADAGVFGPGDPTEEQVQTYWAGVSAARRALSARVGRPRRILAAINVRSLVRGSRPRKLVLRPLRGSGS